MIKKLFVGIIFVVLAASNSFSVSPGEVVINELMWSGSFVSGQDEWLELRNMTDREIDLSNYQLTRNTGEEEKAMITISEKYSIPANGYFLVSNYTEDSSALAAAPDMVSSSLSLSNSALQIKLYDQAGLLIDTAGDGGKPLAGDNTNKCSMERNPVPGDGTSGENWHTASESKGFDPDSKEKGTPGLANSLPETGLPEETVILINEVSFKEENGRDWIELYCLNDGQNGEGIEIGGCFLEDNS
ncbi:lamin tail domain-containing protein, partial [bacterium]|nr:lamin tail domain-containing protein [bacterium]